MKYLSGGTLISSSDLLESKIRIKLQGENSYYETQFKDFFDKKSTAILEAIIDEQLYAHLKSLHDTLNNLKERFTDNEGNVVELLLPDTMLPLNTMQDILPSDDEDN